MNARSHIAFLIFLLLFASVPSRTQAIGSGSHITTVSVQPITVVLVTAGSVTLDIASGLAVAGQDLMTVSNNTTQFLWGTNSSSQKVTVVSDLAAPLYTLQLEATSATAGTPAGPIVLNTTADDFLLNIGRSSGSCTLQYTALVLASQGTGSESHTVTLTVQAQ